MLIPVNAADYSMMAVALNPMLFKEHEAYSTFINDLFWYISAGVKLFPL